MSTIPKEIKDLIKENYAHLSQEAQESFAKGYQLATDGREELEKENASLRETLSCFHWGTVHDTITALQSSLKEKEKQLQESLLLYNNQTTTILKQSTELEELKAENERLKTILTENNL